ncbi:MAG TPA: lytic transglycosylase domain-containing protein [Aquabacterium sp.]|uniref:lytic transglycosylase domain-containing protein n=1 Tax=Aquabacterium sp. TaxID=1872578 RepID=UPI002E3322D0|nr:lytic transglycosylase domain-containing protein [Aquabacterium sp.]HEX5371790.1 lytic transglycosylase domain-containing protein [Aquabacterium sp.]
MKVWRVVAADVLLGIRHVSHNTLALVGLSAVVSAVFLSGRADVRHQLEEQVLGWLEQRALARTTLADEAAPSDILLAMAEPEAITRATAMDPAELNRQQAALVSWISRRYSVAPEPISRLVQEAWSVGKKAGVEPTLILAVMAVESGFNPFAQSHVGAQGLMQVMTGIHRDKYEMFGGRRAAFDPVTNLRVGVQVLKDCIARAGSLQEGLKHYVGAANLTHDGGYASKVLAEQAYLREVVQGRKVAFNAPLPQPGAELPAAVATPDSTVNAPQAAAHPAAPAASGAVAPLPAVAPTVAPAASEAPLVRRVEQVALAR